MKTESSPLATPTISPPPETKRVEPSAPLPEQGDAPAAPPKRRHLLVVVGSLGGALALAFLIPWLLHTLHTVSTDDAYVNSHATFVAPRVAGQVVQVLVDDNNRVRQGEVLVQLDPEPFRIQVAIKQAFLDTARANRAVARITRASP